MPQPPHSPAPATPPPLPPLPPRTRPGGMMEMADRLPWWKQVLFIAGFPVETRQTRLDRPAVVLPAIAALIAAVSIYGWLDPQAALFPWNILVFQPTEQGLSWLVGLLGYPLLHSDAMHLLANLYFLLIFGDNIESQFGRRRFLGLFLASCIAGGLLHGAFTSAGLIGASGGCLGLVVFYACMFPSARVLWLPFGLSGRALFWIIGTPLLHRGFPIWVYLVLCILMDLLTLHEQLFGEGQISALAHLGGSAMGALIAYAWRRGWLP